MPTYIILGNYTDQGIRGIKQRMGALRREADQWVQSKGGRVIGDYMTFGPYDFVYVCELPGDDAAFEAAFTFGSQGEVRTQTLKALNIDEATRIAEQIPGPIHRG
jgi:uncharacterized protein with GYD domain